MIPSCSRYGSTHISSQPQPEAGPEAAHTLAASELYVWFGQLVCLCLMPTHGPCWAGSFNTLMLPPEFASFGLLSWSWQKNNTNSPSARADGIKNDQLDTCLNHLQAFAQLLQQTIPLCLWLSNLQLLQALQRNSLLQGNPSVLSCGRHSSKIFVV